MEVAIMNENKIMVYIEGVKSKEKKKNQTFGHQEKLLSLLSNNPTMYIITISTPLLYILFNYSLLHVSVAYYTFFLSREIVKNNKFNPLFTKYNKF